MNLYILLVTLTIVNARDISDTKCTGVIFDGHCHEKETLKTGLYGPFSLAVDYNTNILYFSYMHMINITLKSAFLDLNTKEFKDISNYVPFGHAQAIDQNTHDVYIGGRGGIYKFDHKNNKSELYVAINRFAYNLFIKDVLYFSVWPSKFKYTYIDGKRAVLEDLKETASGEFIIDGEDVMFYSNSSGLYAQKKGGKDAVLYSNEPVRALALDVHGHAYMCTPHAIYRINKTRISLDKLVDNIDCYGLAFDGYNNII